MDDDEISYNLDDLYNLNNNDEHIDNLNNDKKSEDKKIEYNYRGDYCEDGGTEDREDTFYNFDDLENDVKWHYKYFNTGYLCIKCVTDKREYIVTIKSKRHVKRDGSVIFAEDKNKFGKGYNCWSKVSFNIINYYYPDNNNDFPKFTFNERKQHRLENKQILQREYCKRFEMTNMNRSFIKTKDRSDQLFNDIEMFLDNAK